MLANGSAPGPVEQWVCRVMLNGRDVTARVTGWDAEYTLGQQVGKTPLAVGRGTSTGSVALKIPQTLTPVTDGSTPDPWQPPGWAGWPVMPGAYVTIEARRASDDPKLASSWVPVADMLADEPWMDSRGDAGLSTIDRVVDLLAEQVTLPPLLRIMPPSSVAGSASDPTREIGMHHFWVLDALLSAVGRPTVLPDLGAHDTLLLRASMQGSSWPTRGYLASSRNHPDTDGNIDSGFQPASWGRAGAGVIATWNLGWSPDARTKVVEPASTWQFTTQVGAGHSEAARFRIVLADGKDVRIDVAASRRVYLIQDGTVLEQSMYAAADKPLAVRWTGTQYEMWTGTNAPVAATPGTKPAKPVSVSYTGSPGARIGPIVMHNRPPGGGTRTPTGAEPVTIIETGDLARETLTQIEATPGIENRPIADVLDEILAATLTALTVDERGRIVIKSWVSQLAGALERGITTTDDILDSLKHSWSLQDIASSVVVKHQIPRVQFSDHQLVTVWQGGGGTLEANRVEETWVTTPDDEDWIEVDTSATIATPTNVRNAIGRGTFYGGSKPVGDNDETYLSYNELGMAVDYVNHATIKLTETNLMSAAVSRTLPTGYVMPPGWRQRQMPLLRAYAMAKWIEATTEPLRPSTVGVRFVHEGGKWVSRWFADRPADALAEHMGTPSLIFEQVRIHPDPRIQVGDRIKVKSDRLGLNVDVIVLKKRIAYDGGAMSMHLDLAVVDHEQVATVYRVWERQMDKSWSALEAQYTGETYADLEGDVNANQ